MKRILSLLLAAVLCLGLMPTAFAASDEAETAADTLYSLGLFSGTGVDAKGKPVYDLDRAPTRSEAVTILVGLLGKKEEALSGSWELPFTDVADWAKPFVGYAYANGLTSGVSADTFGGNDLISASQYLTFVLKVLGYEAGKDFQWDKAWELSDAIGLTDGQYSAATTTFTRGDVAVISLNAHQLQEKLAAAPYFGLPADIRWIPVLETVEDLDNNILYSFLLGNYELHFHNIPVQKYNHRIVRDVVFARLNRLTARYPELAGPFSNIFIGFGTNVDYAFIDFPNATLSVEDVYAQQLAAPTKCAAKDYAR